MGKVKSLYLHNNQQSLGFGYNNFPMLKELTITNCRTLNNADFKTNNFPVLESLKFLYT